MNRSTAGSDGNFAASNVVPPLCTRNVSDGVGHNGSKLDFVSVIPVVASDLLLDGAFDSSILYMDVECER